MPLAVPTSPMNPPPVVSLATTAIRIPCLPHLPFPLFHASNAPSSSTLNVNFSATTTVGSNATTSSSNTAPPVVLTISQILPHTSPSLRLTSIAPSAPIRASLRSLLPLRLLHALPLCL